MIKLLHSRTVWTVILIFLLNGIPAVQGYLSTEAFTALNAILSALAIYFKIKPSQSYN